MKLPGRALTQPNFLPLHSASRCQSLTLVYILSPSFSVSLLLPSLSLCYYSPSLLPPSLWSSLRPSTAVAMEGSGKEKDRTDNAPIVRSTFPCPLLPYVPEHLLTLHRTTLNRDQCPHSCPILRISPTVDLPLLFPPVPTIPP